MRAKSFAIILIFCFSSKVIADPVKSNSFPIAITIDDLPASGPDVVGMSRIETAKDIIDALKKNGVSNAYGFVNGILAKNMAERLGILEEWKKAGFQFGNHTFSHKDISNVSIQEFLEDIENNESILIDFAKSIEELKVFRPPYLAEGENHDKRYGLRSYLKRRGYLMAPATVDFEDWAFSEAFSRCSANKNSQVIEELKTLYLKKARDRLAYSRELGRRLYKREVPQILLIHFNALTGKLLDSLLNQLKQEGAIFVSVQSALSDPIYNEDTVYYGKEGVSFLIQAKDSRKLSWRGFQNPSIDRNYLANSCKLPDNTQTAEK